MCLSFLNFYDLSNSTQNTIEKTKRSDMPELYQLLHERNDSVHIIIQVQKRIKRIFCVCYDDWIIKIYGTTKILYIDMRKIPNEHRDSIKKISKWVYHNNEGIIFIKDRQSLYNYHYHS
jgi:hypothetical protein